MLQLYNSTDYKGYVLGKGTSAWKNIDNCIADAKAWFETADFDLCCFDSPILVIEEITNEHEEN